MNYIYNRISSVFLIVVMVCSDPLGYVCAGTTVERKAVVSAAATLAPELAQDVAMSVEERTFVAKFLEEFSPRIKGTVSSPVLDAALTAFLLYGYRYDLWQNDGRTRFELALLFDGFTTYPPEEKAFLIYEKMHRGEEPFVMTKHSLSDFDACRQEIVEAFVSRARADGFLLAGFAVPEFAEAVYVLVENIEQHEYLHDAEAHIAYRFVSSDDGIRIEILGSGRTPFPPQFSMGKSYDAQHRPWNGEKAPEDAWGSGGEGRVGIGSMFDEFSIVDDRYRAVDTTMPVRPMSIIWDVNHVRDHVPDAVGEGHLISVQVPLRRVADNVFVQRIGAFIAANERMIWERVQKRLSSVSDEYAARVTHGAICTEYSWIVAEVLSAVFSIPHSYWHETRFEVRPFVSPRYPGVVHGKVVLYIEDEPVFSIDPMHWEFASVLNARGSIRAMPYFENSDEYDVEDFAKREYACTADAFASFVDSFRYHKGAGPEADTAVMRAAYAVACNNDLNEGVFDRLLKGKLAYKTMKKVRNAIIAELRKKDARTTRTKKMPTAFAISNVIVWGGVLVKVGLFGYVMKPPAGMPRIDISHEIVAPADATAVQRPKLLSEMRYRIDNIWNMPHDLRVMFSDEMFVVRDDMFDPVRLEIANARDYYAVRELSEKRALYYAALPEPERDRAMLLWFDVADRTIAYYDANGGWEEIALEDTQEHLARVPVKRMRVGANSFYRMPDEDTLVDAAEKAVSLPDVGRSDPTLEESMDSLRHVLRASIEQNKGLVREKYISEELSYVMAALVNAVSEKTGITAVVLPNEILTGALGKSEDHFAVEYFNAQRHPAIITGKTVFTETHLDAGAGVFEADAYPKLLLFKPNAYGAAHWSRWLDYENTAIVEMMGLQTLLDTPAEKALIQWARHIETILAGMKERYPDMTTIAFIGGHGGRKTPGYFTSERGTEADGAKVGGVRSPRFLRGEITYEKVEEILQDIQAWPDVAAENEVFSRAA